MTSRRAYSAVLFLAVLAIAAITACSLAVAAPSAGQADGTIRISLPESDVAVRTDADGLGRFSGTDVQYVGQTGEPSIPSQSVRVLLPPDADPATVEATITGYEWTGIDGEWDIPPAGPLAVGDVESTCAVSSKDEAIVNARDPGIYESDALFPAEPIVKVDVQVFRGWKMAQVLFVPFAYNPVEKRVFRLSGNAVEITFERTSLESSFASVDLTSADKVRDMTGNFAEMSGEYGGYAVSADTGRYVIISTSAIQAASTVLSDFVASKEARGFTVQVVTEGTWGGGTGDAAAENLRSWLKTNYVSLNIKYVLLIGNPNPSSGDVPMKMCYPQKFDAAYPECPTDFYYAELTSNDWDKDGDGKYGEYIDDFLSIPPRAAEVAVGRIPYYGSITDLDHILSKIVDYENAPAVSTSWRTKALLPMNPSDNVTPGYHLGEAITDNVLIPEGWTYHRVYDADYNLDPDPETIPCNVANVANAWNASDFGAVFWWAHGLATSAEDVMNSTVAATLDDSHPGFTFQCSCLNGRPEVITNLQYSLLKNGCVSTISASRVSWYEKEQTSFAGTATNSGMTFEYAKRLIAGEMYAADALNGLKADVPLSHQVLWMNYLDFNLYGDPAVGIYTSTPEQAAPSVVSYYANNITRDSALLRANLTSLGTADNATVSFERSTVSGGPYAETGTAVKASTGTFDFNLSGLAHGVTHYYRAKAVGSGGTAYGLEKSFTTLVTPPSVTTSAVSDKGTTWAILNGNLAGRGTADNVTVSFEWGLTTAYGSETTAQPTAPLGNFSENLTGLHPGATYYYRAKAAGDGTAYGDNMTFTTLTVPPSVSTNPANNITASSARLNGNLASLGTADNVTVSFEYGTATGGPYSSIAVGVKNAIGIFSADLTGLGGKTTYYFRAKAVGDGSDYGGELTFTTLTVPPSVSTDDPSDITVDGVRLNGDLNSLGTAVSVTVSFGYSSTSGGPYLWTEDQTVTEEGEFSSIQLNGLLEHNTTYYYRARAVGDGTAYGEEMSFTSGTTPPTVDTNAATGITPTSAALRGTLTSKGTAGSVTVSFEWKANGGSYVAVGGEVRSELGMFSAPLTGLTPGTTYYFRAKAAGHGSDWGEQMSFTTPLPPPVVASVTPASGKMGQSLVVTISGNSFTGATAVSFGSDVVVDNFTVVSTTQISTTQIRAAIRITCDGIAGTRDVAVTTSGGTDTLEYGFTVSNSAPAQPLNQGPADGTSVMTLSPTLSSSAFSHPCPSRAHAASQWQVRTASGDYAKPIFDSGADTLNLTGIVMPEGKLDEHTDYYWHVRHRDDRGMWSAWSAETVFIRIDFLSGALDGPAAIRVTDSSSRVTGIVGSLTEEQIPLSHYLDGTVTIISPGDAYVWEVVGTGDGPYTFTVMRMVEGQSVAFHADGIPVAIGEVHRYVIDWEVLSQGGKGVTIEIDADGDGTFDRNAVVGAEATSHDFGSETSRPGGIPSWAWALLGISVVAGLVSVFILWRMDRNKRQASAVP